MEHWPGRLLSEEHERLAVQEGTWREPILAGVIVMGSLDATPAPLTRLLVVSDGSTWNQGCDQATATFGWVARPHTGLALGDNRVAAVGMGAVAGAWKAATSTRAEAAGVLSAMRATRRRVVDGAWESPLEIDHALDNESVVKVFGTVSRWPALRWLKASDRDIWMAVTTERTELELLGVTYSVRWIRSHPEKRLALEAWSEDDVMNHMADRYAERAQLRHKEMEGGLPAGEICEPGGYKSWTLVICGVPVTGNVRRALQVHSQSAPLRQRLRSEYGDGQDWEVLWGALMKTQRKGMADLVFWLKVMRGLLPTETVLVRRGHGVVLQTDEGGQGCSSPSVCKLCGLHDETNAHMLLHCVGEQAVVEERRRMIDGLKAVLKGVVNTEMWMVMDVLLRVSAEGEVVDWTAGNDQLWANALGEPGLGSEVYEALRDHNGWEGMLRGGTSKRLRAALVERAGLNPDKAHQLLEKVTGLVAQGARSIWKARNEVRAAKVGAGARSLQAEVREALQRLRERGCEVAGQEEYLARCTRRKVRRWLATVRTGQTTLHGRFRSEEDSTVVAARERKNVLRRHAMAEAAQQKPAIRVRQTIITATAGQAGGGMVLQGSVEAEAVGARQTGEPSKGVRRRGREGTNAAAAVQATAGAKRRKIATQTSILGWVRSDGQVRSAGEASESRDSGRIVDGNARKRRRRDSTGTEVLRRSTMRAKD